MGFVIHTYDSRVKPVTPFDIIVVRLPIPPPLLVILNCTTVPRKLAISGYAYGRSTGNSKRCSSKLAPAGIEPAPTWTYVSKITGRHAPGSIAAAPCACVVDAPGIKPVSATFRFGLVSRRSIPRPDKITCHQTIRSQRQQQVPSLWRG